MRCNTFAIVVTAVCILFSGYAYAIVAHPEDSNIVGLASSTFVCFNNDGVLVSNTECNGSSVDEGFLFVISQNWWGGNSGINGCGTTAVNPVSSATCPLTMTGFAACISNGWVLVQTTKSFHFWAVKANGSCGGIATPETKTLVPCRLTDAFDPVLGCTGVTNQSGFRVEGSYIQLETSTVPPVEHCNDTSQEGRMVVDSVNDLLYICTGSGWTYTSLTPTP